MAIIARQTLWQRYFITIPPQDILLGLGAGVAFIYWKMKLGSDDYVFIGGRGNNKEFFNDIGKRTGVAIKTISTSSIKKAEESPLEMLRRKRQLI